MRRFFIDPQNIHIDRFWIVEPKTAKHMRKVLRLKKGDRITLFDGTGNEFEAEIELITKDKVQGSLKRSYEVEAEETSRFVLAQGLPRAGKLDDIIRMNTEVGVSEFLLFESDYSQVKVGDYSKSKLERLQRVAEEAARQSERQSIPQIAEPVAFSVILEQSFDIKVILHSRITGVSVDIADIKSKIGKLDSLLIMVGPEGGFSESELEVAKEKGFTVAHMNLPILRTETAGIVASGILLS